jgi:hypothetical protein
LPNFSQPSQVESVSSPSIFIFSVVFFAVINLSDSCEKAAFAIITNSKSKICAGDFIKNKFV